MPRSSQQQYVKHEEATLDEETVQFEAGSWNDAGAPSLSDNASDYALMRIRLSQQTTRLTWLGLTLGTFLLPVCFGAVHPNVYLPYQICAFSLSILLLFKVRPDTANWRPFVESLGPSTIWAGAMLLVLAAYFLLHYLILVPVDVAHPILQDDRGAVSAFKFWTAWRELLTVCSVFFISSIALRSFRNAPALLIKRIISAAVMVSIIALAHWFYDSGRLFWIFEPNTVVPSDRARWPFVNSNSLAQFLCLPLMLLIGLMIERWQKRSLKLLPRNLSQLSYTCLLYTSPSPRD